MGKLIDYINSMSLEDVWYEVFGYQLPINKFSCPNPEHQHSSNTPSCKVYGNRFKCFGQCNRMFGPYDLYKWYAPERIREIKGSLVIPQTIKQFNKEVLTRLPKYESKEAIINNLICLSKQLNSTTDQK